MTDKKAEDYFNPATYMVTDRVTGEELNVDIFIEKVSQKGWQKSYAKTLCEYIKCADGKAVDLLAYMLESKEYNNMIHGTYRELSTKSNVSVSVVARTFKILLDKKLIKKVRTGCHLLQPRILGNGNKKVGSMMLRLWGDLK